MDGTIRVRTVAWFATAVVLSVFATLLVMQQWRVDAAAGDDDATWVPVEPCRLFDYRAGELPSGDKKSPLVAGSAAVQQVTGSVGNCVLPTSGVVGVSLNVTVVNGTAQSNLRLYPADAAVPLVSNMNWSAGDSPVANKVDVKLSSTGKVKLLNHNGTVDVVGDVVGYYTNSTLQELNQRLLVLEQTSPFAVTKVESSVLDLTATPVGTVFVPVTAPVDGQVTLNSTVNVEMGTNGGDVICAIVLSSAIPANLAVASMQFFENGDPSNEGSLAGTRTFDIAAGTTVEYTLACEDFDDDGSVHKRNLTAIFTPAP